MAPSKRKPRKIPEPETPPATPDSKILFEGVFPRLEKRFAAILRAAKTRNGFFLSDEANAADHGLGLIEELRALVRPGEERDARLVLLGRRLTKAELGPLAARDARRNHPQKRTPRAELHARAQAFKTAWLDKQDPKNKPAGRPRLSNNRLAEIAAKRMEKETGRAIHWRSILEAVRKVCPSLLEK